jgi:hypothetical protein
MMILLILILLLWKLICINHYIFDQINLTKFHFLVKIIYKSGE